MPPHPIDRPCPSHMEDEAFMIETSGEMPEVAMQESLAHLGALTEGEMDCLRGAVARAYLRLLARDLDPRAVGLAHFRGLERAFQNLARLNRFLARLGAELPEATRNELGLALYRYLRTEEEALDRGRPYASASAGQVRELAGALGLDLAPHGRLLDLLQGAPVPDFRGLAALKRLEARGAAYKRRYEREGACLIEVLAEDSGPALARVSLPLLGPGQDEDPQARQRAELVWSLLPLPPCRK